MKKKAIYISIFVSLVIAIAYIYLNIYGFQPYKYTIEKLEPVAERAASNYRYHNVILSSETFEESSYSGGSIGELSYEQFIVNPSLIAIDGNPIPYKKDVREDKVKKAKDATIEPSEYKKLTGDREVLRWKSGPLLPPETITGDGLKERPTVQSIPNPFGRVGEIVAKSRTLARYGSSAYTLTAGEAWIAAHDRTVSTSVPENDYSKARIDKVQSAMWKYKGTNGSEDDFGTNRVAGKVAENLAQEAKWMDAAENNRNKYSSIIKDMKENEYKTKKAGIVTYNENTKEFLVGPFSIDYARDVHEPLKGGLSEMISSKQGGGNLIIYNGIVGAKVHAVVNGSEQELTDWEFVYPNVTESNGTVERTAVANAREMGDAINNIYPYPNEEFYIKFFNPDNSIQALTKLEFDVQALKTQGTARKLTGTFYDINWRVKGDLDTDDYEVPEWFDEVYKVPVKDEDGKIIGHEWEGDWLPVTYWKYTYKAYVDDERAGTLNAATLYQISRAKIYNEVRRVTVKVGEKYTDYKVYPTDYCIPLTMEIGGTVWYDGDEEGEEWPDQNGHKAVDGLNLKDSEMPESARNDKIKVRLWNKTTGQLVPDPLTKKDFFEIGFNEEYLFKYVQVGPKYYVEFEYDWMKYKATESLIGLDKQKYGVSDYENDPGKFCDSSHAEENKQERHDFIMQFYKITTDKGIGQNNEEKDFIDVESDYAYTYDNHNNPYYQEATVREFRKTTKTYEPKQFEVLFPLKDKYAIVETSDRTKTEHMTVGQREGEGVCAITTVDENQKLNYKFTAGSFMKAQTYLRNINLGLVERTQADFAVKSDVVSTTFTINESYSNTNIINDPDDPNNLGYRQRAGDEYLTGDVSKRDNAYFNNYLIQDISNETYNWRHDFTTDKNGNTLATQDDELQVFVLYEYTIRNNSPLINGYIEELSNYFDDNYSYPVGADDNAVNFFPNTGSLYKESAMRFMQYPSYYIKDNVIEPVKWVDSSKYSKKNAPGLNIMYTTSFEDVLLKPGEEIKVYVYYKVNRDKETKNLDKSEQEIIDNGGIIDYKYGEYVKLDENGGKRTVTEINAYRALDYVENKQAPGDDKSGVGGSRVDKNSNPGNIDQHLRANITNGKLDSFKAWQYIEDDTDFSPLLRLRSRESNGKEISGYVWEDFASIPVKDSNGGLTNQWIGDGVIDPEEEDSKYKVDDVEVNLIRYEYDPNKEQYVEMKFSDNYKRYIAATNNKMQFDTSSDLGVQYANGKLSLIKTKRYTGIQPDDKQLENLSAFINPGQYRFTNLIESGQYRVRFTYGNKKQLETDKGLTYNGQDYKSTEFNGWYDQNLVMTDLNQVLMEEKAEISADISILTTDSDIYTEKQLYVQALAKKLEDSRNTDIRVRQKGYNELAQEIGYLSNNTPIESSKVLVLFIDHTVNIHQLQGDLQQALNNNILTIVVATSDVDSRFFNTSFTDTDKSIKSIIYYDQLNNVKNPDHDKAFSELYNRIMNSVIYINLFKEKFNQATDCLETKITEKDPEHINEPIYGRINVMKNTQVIGHELAKTLSVGEIRGITDPKDRKDASDALAELTQVTAESYPVSIHFDDNELVKHINLGLQKIPESSLELAKKVEDIKVTLSNGEEIVKWIGPDENSGKRKNVQYFPGRSYNIYMDKEIMQGATIDIVYRIDVTNGGEVDNLWTYLKYWEPETRKNMYIELLKHTNTKANQEMLNKINNNGLTQDEIDAELKKTIRVQINTLYDYYDNTIFRAEDNNRQDIKMSNAIGIYNTNTKKVTLKRDEIKSKKPLLGPLSDYLEGNLVWRAVEDLKVRPDVKSKIKDYKCVETSSLTDIELYPFKARETSGNCDTVSTYITLSKTLDSKDFMNNDALVYRNCAEIIETYSINGRRFKDSQQGTLVPDPNYVQYDENDKNNQTDSDNAELVKILPPFGTQLLIGGIIAIVSLTAVGVTIYIIRRKRRNF